MNDENHCLPSNFDLIEYPFFSDLADREQYIALFLKWLYINSYILSSHIRFLIDYDAFQYLTSAIYTFRLVLALELHPHQAYPHLVLILPVLLSGSEAYPSTLNIICYGIVMHLYYCFQFSPTQQLKKNMLPQDLTLTAAPPTLSDSLIC